MKKYELIPTEENLIDALYQDKISRNKDIVYFYNILQAQKSACAIAIDGRWGSGKTFFVRQEKLVINALNPFFDLAGDKKTKIMASLPFSQKNEDNIENFNVAVYYDAWENDNDVDPILSLIYEITRQLSTDFDISDRSLIEIAGSIVEAISGRNITGILNALKSDDPFAKFKDQKDIETKIKGFFEKILNERGNRLVIFIDELDRCKPDFAVHLLEQIKHYFSDDRITFVFSVNLEQLQHTIKHYYGADFDSCRYLDRFFDLRIVLPPADMEKFYRNIGLEASYYADIFTRQVIRMYNFQLREIERFYSQVEAAIYAPTHKSEEYNFYFPEGKGKAIILTYIVPLLIGLHMADTSLYTDFVNGKNAEPLKQLFAIDEDDYIKSLFLNNDESFSKEEGKKYVTSDEIIDRLYAAIFVNQYTGGIYHVMIGEYEFTKESRNFALRASGMMTLYADL